VAGVSLGTEMKGSLYAVWRLDVGFATNHKFYGFADLFLDIPRHTNDQGLVDVAAKLALRPEKNLVIGFDLHNFRLAKKRNLDSSRLAEELDITVTYNYSKQA
jgi:hypothetical protein